MTPEAVHRQTAERVHSAMAAAMRAEAQRIGAAALNARLGRPDADFAREARTLVLALAVALTSVLHVHRRGTDPYGEGMCLSCGSRECRTVRVIAEALAAYQLRPAAIDRAEAWRRADMWFVRNCSDRVALTVEEFDAGFVARSSAHQDVLVLDRARGTLTRWPSLPTAELVEQYAQYRDRC
ncbi:hypothetical protein AB0L06_26890 [Spirillospora sp. NPDC052269]